MVKIAHTRFWYENVKSSAKYKSHKIAKDELAFSFYRSEERRVGKVC